MRRIMSVAQGVADLARDTVRLDFERRNRRRSVIETRGGETLLLDMPRAVHLRDGDLLRLEDGGCVVVESADEALVEIAAADSAALVRIAWHLGNRHLPTQLVPGAGGGALRIRADHVIVAMAEGLGARCTPIDAPFDPEGGAYAAGTGGHHAHHDHGVDDQREADGDHGKDGHHHHAH